jgi:hypothetical protein
LTSTTPLQKHHPRPIIRKETDMNTNTSSPLQVAQLDAARRLDADALNAL